MATSTAEDRKVEVPGEKAPLVVVELAKRRSPEQIKRLRKGRGKLVGDIEETIAELVNSGTVKADVQPVVIVVRETSLAPLLALTGDDDDDEDDDNDDDEDDDEDQPVRLKVVGEFEAGWLWLRFLRPKCSTRCNCGGCSRPQNFTSVARKRASDLVRGRNPTWR